MSENDDSLSAQERYDIKAYRFNQYFPVPKPQKTEAEKLEEERQKLGLETHNNRRQISISNEDQEPRFEISKLSNLASKDLDLTNSENLGEMERYYGDGVHVGGEIDAQIRQITDDKKAREHEKQLVGRMNTFQ